MSAKQPIQAKGDIVYNPKTNRPIKVGSRAWLNLVKQGVIAGEYADDNVLDEYNEEESKQEIKKRIKELNEKQDLGTQVVRGRGVYKGKLVKRSKALSVQDISKKTSKIASKIVVDDEDEKLEKELEAMIYNELMKGKPKKVKQPVSKPLKQPKMSRSKTVPKKPVVVETEDNEHSDTNNYSEDYKIEYEDDECGGTYKEDDWSSEDE